MRKKKEKYQSLHAYLDYEDLFKQLGYRVFKPKIGSLGQALIQASKINKSKYWLKRHLDKFFNNLSKGKQKNNEL